MTDDDRDEMFVFAMSLVAFVAVPSIAWVAGAPGLGAVAMLLFGGLALAVGAGWALRQ